MNNQVFHVKPSDWTWWAWFITAALLAAGLAGYEHAFLFAMGATTLHAIPFIVYEKTLVAFSVQLRVSYLAILGLSHLPSMQWMYWVPTIGTFGLSIFGYCLLARTLSLMPWNSREPYSWDRLKRTFLSRPDLGRLIEPPKSPGCAGGLCTIEAQVAPPTT